jgi:RNA polymerase sigma-70 factor, ECF subfamily
LGLETRIPRPEIFFLNNPTALRASYIKQASILHPEPAQTSDIELLHAVARNEEGALTTLYDRYRLLLFGLLVRILNSRDEAEDVLQEVFLQVWRRAADFDETRGRPFTWLVTLTRSRAIDRLRVMASRQRLVDSAKSQVGGEATDAAFDTFLAEQREIVAHALATLPEEQRRTLRLAYFEGLTQSEIAAKLGSPLGTVKTRMRAGMTTLRELLSEQLPSPFGSKSGF